MNASFVLMLKKEKEFSRILLLTLFEPGFISWILLTKDKSLFNVKFVLFKFSKLLLLNNPENVLLLFTYFFLKIMYFQYHYYLYF